MQQAPDLGSVVGKELDQRIIELRREGLTYRAIQAELGCGPELVNSALKKVGLAKPQTPLSLKDEQEIWRLFVGGLSRRKIAVAKNLGRHRINKVINKNGGVIPKEPVSRSPRQLSPADREEISRLLTTTTNYSEIARAVNKHRSSIKREIDNNGGLKNYRAWSAEQNCVEKAKRPRESVFVWNHVLREIVQAKLMLEWSPEQIANWLKYEEFPLNPEMWVSHETIYQSLFIQSRGGLKKELTLSLRTGRALRKSRSRTLRQSIIADMVNISERPAEIEDRAIPGHWEGDLIIGAKSASAIATLVERTTRFLILVKLEGDHTTETVTNALIAKVSELPQELRKTLTWDQGVEMASHAKFKVAIDIKVFFCDPHSPWQRGTNENTNGLIRQYFPKGTDLSVHSQEHLDFIAHRLNTRPRKALAWKTPGWKFDELVAKTG